MFYRGYIFCCSCYIYVKYNVCFRRFSSYFSLSCEWYPRAVQPHIAVLYTCWTVCARPAYVPCWWTENECLMGNSCWWRYVLHTCCTVCERLHMCHVGGSITNASWGTVAGEGTCCILVVLYVRDPPMCHVGGSITNAAWGTVAGEGTCCVLDVLYVRDPPMLPYWWTENECLRGDSCWWRYVLCTCWKVQRRLTNLILYLCTVIRALFWTHRLSTESSNWGAF